MLVPVIKDKTSKITANDNYRPLALASIVSKVVEIILLDRMPMYFVTSPNQFGFKKKLSTDMCIHVHVYALNEIIDAYRVLNGSIFGCYLDASKAFDRVNRSVLFEKLVRRGVPGYIVIEFLCFGTLTNRCVSDGGIHTLTALVCHVGLDKVGFSRLISLISMLTTSVLN